MKVRINVTGLKTRKLRPVVLAMVALSLIFLPAIPGGHGNASPTWPWLPAGPSMDTLNFQSFSDVTSELIALQAGSIDLTDSPCSPALCASLATSPNYYVTPTT